MTLVVENGTGLSTAESYLSVTEADAYHVGVGQGDAWDNADDKEVALRKAAQYMQQEYRLRWLGYRIRVDQGLDWPRAEVPIPDAPYGYGSAQAYVPINVVPKEVKQAQAELALRSLTGTLQPDLGRTVRREKVGPLETEYDVGGPRQTEFTPVDNLLSPYLGGGGGISVKMERV